MNEAFRRFSSGFSLVEITLALGVAALCLLGVFALLPIGLQSNHAAVQQTLAANILEAVVADLRNTPAGSTESPQYRIPIVGSTTPIFVDETGSVSTIDQRFRVTVVAVGTPDNLATWLRASVSWPAAAASNPLGSVDVFVALE